MESETTKLKHPASSPANKEEKKTKGDKCSKLNNEQCKVIANLNTPNIVFFCSSCIQVFPVALRCYDSQPDIDSKVSTLEKSVSEIQLTESKLNKIMKNVETQLEKH